MKFNSKFEIDVHAQLKVFKLEEATKIFNRVLEIQPQDEAARRNLAECCLLMNAEYGRMKGIKKMNKVCKNVHVHLYLQ
jgi:hypothetical protein